MTKIEHSDHLEFILETICESGLNTAMKLFKPKGDKHE